MFTTLDISLFIHNEKEKSISEKKILISQYSLYRDTILLYCETHNVIISNPYLLIDVQHIDNMLSFDLYSVNPFRHANNLSNVLLKHTKNIEMQTMISHSQFNIRVNSQIMPIVNFYKLPIAPTQTVIGREAQYISKSIGTYKIMLMPAHVELLNIYRKLYLPSYADSWEKLYSIENTLWHTIIKPPPVNVFVKDSPNIKNIIFNKWCVQDGIVIIGYWAIDLLSNIDTKLRHQLHKEKLQIISSNTIMLDILSLQTFVQNEFTETTYTLTYSTSDIDIPLDFRIKKYTIWIQLDNKKIGIMEIFNSAQFELIPYLTKNNVKIGNPFVLCRFLFIDYWIIEFVMSINKLPENIGCFKLNIIMTLIERIRTHAHLGFGKKYTGFYIDEVIADKLRRIESTHHVTYIPFIKQRII